MRPERTGKRENNRNAHLKPEERQALEEFVWLVREFCGNMVKEIRLFGSKARGDDRSNSDIDVLIIVNERDPQLDDQILEAAFKVGLKLDVLLIPVVFTQEEYYSPLAKKTLFYENTQREAIPL